MENYQSHLIERNWQRLKRQCFFLVQWRKTYQLFSNSCNRCRIRMGILHKNSSRLFSWSTALRLSYSSQLQRHRFDRRINQGTSWILCKKIQGWYLKNRLTNHQHPFAVTRGSFERVVQENRSGESFRRIVQENRLGESSRRIVQENRPKWSFEIIIFTPSSDLTRGLWRACEYYSPVNNLSCLKIKVVSRMRKNRLWNQCWFQGWLEIKVKFMNCL